MLPKQSALSSGCCQGGAASPSPSPRSRRGCEVAAGALSIGVWVFMPKCPMCLAAHLALWTGLGLSFAEATLLRWSLLLLSGALLLCLLAKRVGVLRLTGMGSKLACRLGRGLAARVDASRRTAGESARPAGGPCR